VCNFLSFFLIYFIVYPSRRPSPSFFFNDTTTTDIYTLSLHDALPILKRCSTQLRTSRRRSWICCRPGPVCWGASCGTPDCSAPRSEEHTSELQSRENLVCRLLLEKKKKPCCCTN